MSSRELVDELLGIVTSDTPDGTVLEAAEFLPDTSALNVALRGGDWSRREYREARMVMELALSRADGRGYTPDLDELMSPAQIFAENEHLAWKQRRHDENLAQLRGER